MNSYIYPFVCFLSGWILVVIAPDRCVFNQAMGRSVPSWSKAKKPSKHTAQSIGSYAGGCLQGGQLLSETGKGYTSIRRFRNRFYAHPHTLEVVQSLGRWVADLKMRTLEIGDLSQPRGGLMTYGHRSHQSGLDVDLWFGYPPSLQTHVEKQVKKFKKGLKDSKKMSRKQKNQLFDLEHPSVLMKKREQIDPKTWSDRHLILLYLATLDPRVERIFVHWQIKSKLCSLHKKKQLDHVLKNAKAYFKKKEPNFDLNHDQWLRKIRPWYGHHQHFHIRLACPSDSPKCTPQTPLPNTAGCDRQFAWFSFAAQRKRKKEKKAAELKAKKERDTLWKTLSKADKKALKNKEEEQKKLKKQKDKKKQTLLEQKCQFLSP